MSDLDSDNKRCKDCGEVKPASESWRCEQSSDGLSLYGKECFGLSDAAAYRKRQAAIGKTPRAYRRHSRVPEGVKHCARSAETKPITDPGRDPAWTPNCSRCNVRLPERTGSGRRLCDDCFGQTYDLEDRRSNGAHRVRLKPCSLCGGPKERMARGKMCQACKPWAG